MAQTKTFRRLDGDDMEGQRALKRDYRTLGLLLDCGLRTIFYMELNRG